MTDFPVRHFDDDAAIERLGEDFLARTLPKAAWTHEAHLATALYLALRHPELVLERDLPNLIARYNVSVGGTNSDTEGYHETITQAYLRGLRLFLEEADCEAPLHELVNDYLHSPMGKRDWPLRFWSKDRLLGTEARRGWVEPDLAALP